MLLSCAVAAHAPATDRHSSLTCFQAVNILQACTGKLGLSCNLCFHVEAHDDVDKQQYILKNMTMQALSLCRSVTAWRKWYHGPRGQGGPFKAEGAPLSPPNSLRREEILDRYAQHVKSCPSCTKVCFSLKSFLMLLITELHQELLQHSTLLMQKQH